MSNSSLPDYNINSEESSKKIYLYFFIFLLVIGLLIYLIKSKNGKEEVMIASDVFCVIFQALDESGLGKPFMVTEPLTFRAEVATSSEGLRFQQIIPAKMVLIMEKYGWDSGKLGQEIKAIQEKMTKKEFFKNEVFSLLRERPECHPEFLD